MVNYQQKRRVKQVVLILIPVVVLLSCVLFKDWIYDLATGDRYCIFYRATGYYCPSCGGTRAVFYMLDLHFLQSLVSNPIPLVLAVLGALWYIEMLFLAFGKRVHLLPKNKLVYYIVIALFITFLVLRNFIPWLMPANI